MLTKVVSQALLPLNLSIELLLVGLLLRRLGWKRTGRVAVVASVALLWLASTPVVSTALVRSLEDDHAYVAPEDSPTADAIVVLGGALGPARPPRGAADLGDGADRLLHAARLHRAGRAPFVVPSGGSAPWSGSGKAESDDMADLLVEWGVPRDAILVEAGSLDTRGNAEETKRVLDVRGARRVLLVTSALHMPRALAAFRAVGVDAVPSPTDYLGVSPESGSLLRLLPDAQALAHTTAVAHEWLGTLWYGLRGWL
jgi:uncharacterized SAM-binding protein YcdF (DUF218 family)